MNYCTIVPDIVRSFYMSTVETNKRLFIIIIIINFGATVPALSGLCEHRASAVNDHEDTCFLQTFSHT